MRVIRFLFRALWKTVKWGVLLGIIAVAVLTGYLYYVARHSMPSLDGLVYSARLNSEVRVIRDNWGVPHILATNETDAYYALGYCMAQDRLFQMELMRRLARGELAELLGPPVVFVDKVMRGFRLRAKAEEFLEITAPKMPPELIAAMDAFLDGVNDFQAAGPLPFEFTVLQIPVRPFTKADSLAVAAILPISFADGLRVDPLVSLLKQQHPDLDIDTLFPVYKFDCVTVMEGIQQAAPQLQSGLEGERALQMAGALDSIEQWVLMMDNLAHHTSPEIGSNSWVLGPSRTKSGKPIMANDPHIAFTNPSIWYEAHLKYGDFENYGYHLPPIPLPIIGHNEDRAWGMTMFSNDDVDMYLETFHPNDPTKVMYKGQWIDTRIEHEIIKVRFGNDVTYDVRVTPHGPVVTDLLNIFELSPGPAVSLRWVWQSVEYTDILGIYEMGHARDLDSFGKAVLRLTSPGINVSYTDAAGNIAWWAAGVLPVRPPHIRYNELLDGASGQDEIENSDYLPPEQNPHLINPPCGYIVTANNLSSVNPVGTPPKVIPALQGYWEPADRAGRITEIIEARSDWTVEDLKAVQMDDHTWASPKLVPIMVAELRAQEAVLSELQRRALDMLEQWNYRHDVDSQGALVYELLCNFTLRNALTDEMGESLFSVYATAGDHWNYFKRIMETPESHYWDDITTPETETRTDILVRSLKGVQAELVARIGEDPAKWKWGTLHTMEFKHPFGYLPLLGRIFNIGPFPSPGSAQAVNNMLYERFNNFSVIAGPSTRRLIDYADPAHSLTILPTGNSGHFLSEHYGDQGKMFVNGEYRPALYLQSEIEAAREHEMRFVPKK